MWRPSSPCSERPDAGRSLEPILIAARLRRAASTLAVAAVALLLLSGRPAAAAPEVQAALRCLEMIALFDRIVQGRLDTRVLQIESWELAEARRLRAAAEVDCAIGNYWFGIGAIEDALMIVGVVPPTAFDEQELE